MLKQSSRYFLVILLNLILLASIGNIIHKIMVVKLITLTEYTYQKQELQHEKFIGILMLNLILYVTVLMVLSTANTKSIFVKSFLSLITAFFLCWLSTSLYSTFNLFISIKEPKVFFNFLLFCSIAIILPFTEMLIIKFISKINL